MNGMSLQRRLTIICCIRGVLQPAAEGGFSVFDTQIDSTCPALYVIIEIDERIVASASLMGDAGYHLCLCCVNGCR